jgi:CheY-like chemotaxis protein
MHTLLITDDHPSVLHTLEFVLASAELHVLVAESGAAALERIEQEPVHAALIDLHMPTMDGLTLTRELKARAAKLGRGLPIWIMTAAPTAGAAEQARLDGAEGMLKKPFDADAFRVSCCATWPPPPLRPSCRRKRRCRAKRFTSQAPAARNPRQRGSP